MQEINVSDLKPIESLESAVMHKSGVVLLNPGEALDEDVIKSIASADVDSLFFLEGTDRVDEARRNLTHTQLPIDELNPGDTLTRTLYDDGGRLLLEDGSTIPKNFADSLKRRGISLIYFRKPQEELEPKEGRELRAAIEALFRGDVAVVDKEVIAEISSIKLEEASEDDFDSKKLANRIDRLDKIEIKPDGEAFMEKIRSPQDAKPATEREKQAYSNTMKDCLNIVKQVFDDIRGGRIKSIAEPLETVATQVMAGTIRNRELLMLCGTATECEEYLVHHSLAMAALAVNVGASMGYDARQVKSLAFGALLSDVGMFKVPEEIINKTEKLTPREAAEIRMHPSYGLDVLQKSYHLPAEVPYVVYQSHERVNGSGYPRGKKDLVIHPFAKIVSTVDIYCSMCSDRPYRPAKHPYEAMEHLVLMVGKRILNSEVVRAFLHCNSMFPVGSFVRLSDGKYGRVVVANGTDFMKPQLALLADGNDQPFSDPRRFNLVGQDELKVKSAINITDLPMPVEDQMIGF